MSEQTDATEDRRDDDVEQPDKDREVNAEPENETDQPQPWAKALPGDRD